MCFGKVFHTLAPLYWNEVWYFFVLARGKRAQLVFMARFLGVEVRRIAEIMKKISRRKLV